VIQGSQAWLDCRVGKVTASRVGDVFTKPRKGSLVSKVREGYLADLLAERLTGRPTVQNFGDDSEDGPAAWGKKMEPLARAAYEERTGNKVDLVGFVDHPLVPMTGSSPDGVIGNEGGIEIKAPNTKTHLETVRKGIIPKAHLPQIRWNMACTGRIWWDFLSFDPRAEEEQYFCRRLEADPDELRAMEMGVFAFVMELEARVAAYQWMEEERQ